MQLKLSKYMKKIMDVFSNIIEMSSIYLPDLLKEPSSLLDFDVTETCISLKGNRLRYDTLIIKDP